MNLHENGCQYSKADCRSGSGLLSFIRQCAIPQNLIECRQGTMRISAINMYTANTQGSRPYVNYELFQFECCDNVGFVGISRYHRARIGNQTISWDSPLRNKMKHKMYIYQIFTNLCTFFVIKILHKQSFMEQYALLHVSILKDHPQGAKIFLIKLLVKL